MNDVEQRVLDWLREREIDFELMEIDPDFADTAAFCEKYDIPLENSANTILVASKKAPRVYAAGIVLSTGRLDVNKKMTRLMGIKRASFASSEEMTSVTGMMVGGVTPFAFPADIPVYVDAAVMAREWIIVGGGGRSTKLRVSPSVLNELSNVEVVDGLTRS